MAGRSGQADEGQPAEGVQDSLHQLHGQGPECLDRWAAQSDCYMWSADPLDCADWKGKRLDFSNACLDFSYCVFYQDKNIFGKKKTISFFLWL